MTKPPLKNPTINIELFKLYKTKLNPSWNITVIKKSTKEVVFSGVMEYKLHSTFDPDIEQINIHIKHVALFGDLINLPPNIYITKRCRSKIVIFSKQIKPDYKLKISLV